MNSGSRGENRTTDCCVGPSPGLCVRDYSVRCEASSVERKRSSLLAHAPRSRGRALVPRGEDSRTQWLGLALVRPGSCVLCKRDCSRAPEARARAAVQRHDESFPSVFHSKRGARNLYFSRKKVGVLRRVCPHATARIQTSHRGAEDSTHRRKGRQ